MGQFWFGVLVGLAAHALLSGLGNAFTSWAKKQWFKQD
jgi:hypothetical protein